MTTSSQMPADNVEAEAWLLHHVTEHTISTFLGDTDESTLKRATWMLDEALPLNTQNPFWERHELPHDIDRLDLHLQHAIVEVNERHFALIAEGFPRQNTLDGIIAYGLGLESEHVDSRTALDAEDNSPLSSAATIAAAQRRARDADDRVAAFDRHPPTNDQDLLREYSYDKERLTEAFLFRRMAEYPKSVGLASIYSATFRHAVAVSAAMDVFAGDFLDHKQHEDFQGLVRERIARALETGAELPSVTIRDPAALNHAEDIER